MTAPLGAMEEIYQFFLRKKNFSTILLDRHAAEHKHVNESSVYRKNKTDHLPLVGLLQP